MRDIRPDLFERISQATKSVADARYALSIELTSLQAKHQPDIDKYVTEIEQLKLLLDIEQERHDLATLADRKQQAELPKRVLDVKSPIPILSEPIKSEADAKWRLDRLSALVRDYVHKDEVATNILRLPTDVVARAKLAS